MTRDHGRYEALAGAILLGEAGEAESRAYAEHAATCQLCDPHIDASRTLLASAMLAARGGETWRPFVRDGVLTRIENGRVAFGRRMALGLGGAVAATVALNVALGLSGMPDRSGVAPAAGTRPPRGMAQARSASPALGGAPERFVVLRTRVSKTREERTGLDIGFATLPGSSEASSSAAPVLVALPFSTDADVTLRR